MNNFKVGDLLVGTVTNPYGVTNQWAIVKVLSITEYDDIYVKVVKLRPTAPEDTKQMFKSNHYIGFEDWVNSRYFELYESEEGYYYNPELNKFGYFEDKENLIRV